MSDKIYLAKSTLKGAGRGVFAKRNINLGETIETCPVFVLPRQDYSIIKKTALRNYYFMWGKTTAAICFGNGSLYNHSYRANSTYRKNIKEQTIDFLAVENIKKDQEITVNYNYGQPENKKTLWIDSIPKAN